MGGEQILGGVRGGSPEYLPPLLRLMKQRMRRMRRRSTTELTKPMNHPLVANPPTRLRTTGGEGKYGRGG